MKLKDAKNINLKEALDSISKINFTFNVKDPFKDIKIKDKRSVKGLVVDIEASHSGIINENNFFYLPKGMEDGAPSFHTPYPKPVLTHHDSYTDPIGRVFNSSYVNYDDDFNDLKTSSVATDIIEQISDFVKSDTFNDKDYKGLGHLHLEAEITDEDAIQKILDGRYLTVSIGGSSDAVICSKCGANVKDEYAALMRGEDSDNDCMHIRGEQYSDSEPPLFFIGGLMDFDEISYVSSPADPNAISRIANSKTEGTFRISDSKFDSKRGVLKSVFKLDDNNHNKESKMMKKLKDFLSNQTDALALVKQVLKDMGLEKLTATDEKYASLKRPSYLFADEKILPIHDKSHILAAYKILEDIEDEEGSTTLTSAIATLDAKAKRVFGETHDRAEILKALVDEIKKEESENKQEDSKTEVKDEAVATSITVDYEVLSDLVSKKLSDLINTENTSSYDFLLKRVDMLEKELEEALEDNTVLTDTIKDYIIDHISTIDSTADVDGLKDRSIDSLQDKLKDLKGTKSAAHTKDQENEEIEDPEASVKDAKSDESEIEDTEVENKTKPEYTDSKIVAAEYKRILRAEGLKAAGKYLDDLRKTNKVHPDFRLY